MLVISIAWAESVFYYANLIFLRALTLSGSIIFTLVEIITLVNVIKIIFEYTCSENKWLKADSNNF